MPRSKKQKLAADKSRAYSWVAYMVTHESDEIKRVLKYGTPSDRLIELAAMPIEMKLANGTTKKVFFPESLNKRAGQNLLFQTAKRVTHYIRTVPLQAYSLYEDIKLNLKHRRQDTLSNYLMVAEAVCHRSASEYKHEVLFAFDSILAWIKAAYNKDLGYLTIRKALESLELAGFVKVHEWGVRGDRKKCTKIQITPDPRETILTYTSKVDDWLMSVDHAMFAVYTRENVARLDVLEERIHHYADQMALKDESRHAQGYRLFPVSDDTLTETEVLEEDGVWTDEYIDRLLGRLVPAVQENDSCSREGSKGAGRQSSFSESERRRRSQSGLTSAV